MSRYLVTTFSKSTLARFLGCDTAQLNRILDRLRIARWYQRQFTEAEVRAIMAQHYFRKGGIANRVLEPRDKG